MSTRATVGPDVQQGKTAPEIVLEAVGLAKVYPPTGGQTSGLPLFRDLSLQVNRGEMVSIVGRSGTGKSSLLHLLAGLDQPSAGEVRVGPTTLAGLHPTQLAMVRNRYLGFVWQFHYLLPEFSAVENVAMPLLARGLVRQAALRQAHEWLERVGLRSRAAHRSGELSGGEQQRVAVARALITDPLVLLADEPTGDLDDTTAAALFDLLHELCRQRHLAILLVTHNTDMAARCDRRLRLTEGRLEAVEI